MEERIKTMDPDENKIYKFLGIELASGIQTKTVFERVKEEVLKEVKMIANNELNDANLIEAIKMKVIPVAAYETRLHVACYMAKLINRWIEAAWKREAIKKENAIIVESVKTMEEDGVRLCFEGKSIRLGNEVIDEQREWKPKW